MKRLILWIALLFIAPLTFARPVILVVQDYAEIKDDKFLNEPLAEHLAKALGDTGKFDAIEYKPDLPAILNAIQRKRLASAQVNPNLDAAREIAIALNCDYFVLIRAINDSEKLDTSARLFTAVGRKPIWSANKVYQIKVKDETDWIATDSGAARSIAMIIASEPLKSVPVTKATGDDPKATLPEAAIREKSNETEPEALRIGLQILEEGRATEAIGPLREAVDADPMNPNARVALIKAYLQAKQPMTALDECKRARLLIGDNGALQNAYAMALLETGSFEDAESAYKSLILKSPDDSSIHLGLGDLYLARLRTLEAIEEYKLVVKVSPTDSEPYLRLAKAWLMLDDYDQSAQANAQAKDRGISLDARVLRARYREIIPLLETSIKRMGTLMLVIRQEARNENSDISEVNVHISEALKKINSLANYLETIDVPLAYSGSHRRYLLAAQLLAQAATTAHKFKTKDQTEPMDDALVLTSEAMEELKQAHAEFQFETVSVTAGANK
ncbi:MAG: tetratricopeptide repeat protein [bacterium]